MSEPINLRRYSGRPGEILANAKLLELLLPIHRDDFALLKTYRYRPEAPLLRRIASFWGDQDAIVVALMQPFIPPSLYHSQTYYFGQVVALVAEGSRTAVLVHLCDRAGAAILTDEQNRPVLYSFWLDEVEWSGDLSP
ncbi:MAG TPA: hypothetical protein ACFE0H_11460 [Elainellaceae cyanobacterium]